MHYLILIGWQNNFKCISVTLWITIWLSNNWKYKFSIFFFWRACVGFDIDEDALSVCAQNVAEFEINNIELIQGDITKSHLLDTYQKKFDVVIMNPPFGTKKNEGQLLTRKFIFLVL